MTTDKTIDRLQEAAHLLAMIEEMLASGMSSRPSVNSGMKITVRNAREAVIRSCVEVRREQVESKAAPIPPAPIAQAPSTNAALRTTTTSMIEVSASNESENSRNSEPGKDTTGADVAEQIALRRRDLRASLEKLIDRNL
jgi:hypothetical protein